MKLVIRDTATRFFHGLRTSNIRKKTRVMIWMVVITAAQAKDIYKESILLYETSS